MSLRDRQTIDFPLTKGAAAILTFIGACVVWFLSVKIWQPMLGIPDELRAYIAMVSSLAYLFTCMGRVPPNQEYAQLLFGSYTGTSFPAGIYLLPRLPFPVFSLLLRFNKDLDQYFGWILEGSVSIQSITANLTVSGMTQDGIRIAVSGKLVFEIKHPHVFLSQTQGGTDRGSLIEAVEAECAARVKTFVIARYRLKQLQQGSHQSGSERINTMITKVCVLAKEFGLELVRSPIVEIDILSEEVREVFDRVFAQELFARNLANTQGSFVTFCKALSKEFPDMTEAEAMALWSQAQAHKTGVPRLNIHRLK